MFEKLNDVGDHERFGDEQFRVMLQGAGEHGALLRAGGVEATHDVGGGWHGLEGEPEGFHLFGVPAGFERVHVALGRARAGTAAAAWLWCWHECLPDYVLDHVIVRGRGASSEKEVAVGD